MRAYLQRTEVRLSTIHRVAVGFISGAGLLFLFPVFLKDSILVIVRAFIDYTPDTRLAGSPLNALALILLIFPFMLSLAIPATTLLLLIRDTIRFYFVGHAPGFPEDSFNPRFVLTGVAFPPDESETLKSKILMHEYGSDLIHFVLPFDEEDASDFSALIDDERTIVPRSRKLPKLMVRGIVESADQKPIDQLTADDSVLVNGIFSDEQGDHQILGEAFTRRTVKDIDRFNAALGLAGFVDRPLREEVAKQEVSIVRHSLKLRQLMFRYFQALLILLWTALVTFLMIPFLQDTKGRFSFLFVMGVAYTIWSVFAPFVVQLPDYWLVTQTKPANRSRALKWLQRADGLTRLENLTRRLTYVSIAFSVLALVIELYLRVS